MNPSLVDIHCHLVPEIDDGAIDLAESMAMARMAAKDGIRTIIATPHQLGGYTDNRGDSIRDAVAKLNRALQRHEIPLRVLPGADIRVEEGLVEGILSGDVLSLGDHRKHVLLELPHELYLPLDTLLDQLIAAGVAGILSHPERNRALQRQPEVIERLVDRGCLMQVTAGSLLGSFGSDCRDVALWMAHRRLIHFVATDAHGLRRRRPRLSSAWNLLADQLGPRWANRWCCEHPAAVANGQDVPEQPDHRENRSWWSRLWPAPVAGQRERRWAA